MIVLNEREYAEDCLRNSTLKEKPSYTLDVLAKYYYHVKGFKKKKISELLTDFADRNFEYYHDSRAFWDARIESVSSNARNRTLHEINEVWITENELSAIEAISDPDLERLAFTLLCLAKYNHAKNKNNDYWVNQSAKEIFSLARVTCRAKDRPLYLNKLVVRKMLGYAKRNDNTSVRVTYVDEDSPKALCISDFRELGYEYMFYKGGNFTRCQECGILIKDTKNHNRKFCKNCDGYEPIKFKAITCVDCGKMVKINPQNKRTCRCEECQEQYRRQYKRDFMRKLRES